MQPNSILFASPPLAGHTNQLLILAKELQERGFLIFFACGQAFERQIRDFGIFINWEPESIFSEDELLYRIRSVWHYASLDTNILRGEGRMFEILADTYPVLYRTLKSEVIKHKPDLVVADSAAVAASDLGIEFKIPTVVVAQFLGFNVPTPSYLPQFGTSFLKAMSVSQRFLNRLHPLRLWLALGPAFKKLEQNRKKCGIQFTLEERQKAFYTLVLTTFDFEIERRLPENVAMVGPIVPQPLPDLPPELKQWLDAAKRVVYMSFGTLATLTRDQASKLIEGLSSNDFHVLWSLREDQKHILSSLPANFRIESFVAQPAVLAHTSIKAFVSHCGINSINESLLYGKPILGIPFFGDQYYNAARLVDLGAGDRISKMELSPVKIREKINSILSSPQFSENAARVFARRDYAQGLRFSTDLLMSLIKEKPTGFPKS